MLDWHWAKMYNSCFTLTFPRSVYLSPVNSLVVFARSPSSLLFSSALRTGPTPHPSTVGPCMALDEVAFSHNQFERLVCFTSIKQPSPFPFPTPSHFPT